MNRQRSRARRGYTLVFFAMFLFGFMALAALVIDIGFARLAQRQMQTAVDAAALEGLRFRNRDEVPKDLVNAMVEAGVNPADASDPEYARRWLASRIVAWTFDDNLDPGDGDLIGFGAGPVVELGPPIEGAEDLNAGQLLTLPDTPFYKPVRSDGTFGLEPNVDNEVYGDMVAGAYDPEQDHDEDADYTRKDFRSKKDFTTPEDEDSAFLVRMRRTNNFGGLDRVDEVSSHGPPIPYLFGLGAFFPAGSPNLADGYSPRHHGMTVRATGIADARPVLSVGWPNRKVKPPLTGLVTNDTVGDDEMSFSFVLELGYWNSDELMNKKATVTNTGQIEIQDDYGAKQEVGRFYELEHDPELRKLLMPFMPLVIGRVIGPELPPPAGSVYGSYTGYVPIYTDISGMPRVIGFGRADAEVGPHPVTSEPTVTITRHESKIADENASAIVCYALDVNGEDFTAVLEKNREMEYALFAPVSAR